MLPSLPPLLPGGMPLLGHLRAFYRDRTHLLNQGYAACGPIFRLRLGPQSMVVLVGPTYHEFFFEQTDQKAGDGPRLPVSSVPCSGNR